jgi:hypothetical protein
MSATVPSQVILARKTTSTRSNWANESSIAISAGIALVSVTFRVPVPVFGEVFATLKGSLAVLAPVDFMGFEVVTFAS